jgi:hypothetical protein
MHIDGAYGNGDALPFSLPVDRSMERLLAVISYLLGGDPQLTTTMGVLVA